MIKFLIDKVVYDKSHVNNVIKLGHLELVEKMYSKCPDLFTKYPMKTACECGLLEIVQFLDENLVDYDKSACNSAIKNGHLPVVKYLIRNNKSYSVSALEYAKEQEFTEIVDYLEGRLLKITYKCLQKVPTLPTLHASPTLPALPSVPYNNDDGSVSISSTLYLNSKNKVSDEVSICKKHCMKFFDEVSEEIPNEDQSLNSRKSENNYELIDIYSNEEELQYFCENLATIPQMSIWLFILWTFYRILADCFYLVI